MTTQQIADADAREIEEFLKCGIRIPSQPKVLLEIDALTKRSGTSNRAIANAIAQDPGLAAALFKVVNSPALGLAKKVNSIESAITLLGLKQVVNLVKGVALRQALGGDAAVYEKFWERAGDIARLAALVAQKQVSVCNIFPDQAYMAGLFYECGVPLLMQRFPEYCKSFRLAGNSGWPHLVEEDRLLNTDHSVVGYLVSRYWHLPDFISQCIRHHHDIARTDDAARAMVALLQMAMHLYNIRYQLPDAPEWEANLGIVLQELGLNQEGLREFEEDILDAFSAN